MVMTHQRSKELAAGAGKASIHVITTPTWMNSGLQIQSEDVEDDIHLADDQQGATTTSQNVSFKDAYKGSLYKQPKGSNPVALVDGTEDIRLGEFLSRPTKIGTFTWDQSTLPGTQASLSPWLAFFSNAQIKKKVDNFAFVRCRLHLKFVVNASPFLYGFAFVTYKPNEAYSWSPVRNNSTNGYMQQIQHYQKPHVDILPGKSAGGEMTLPMVFKGNWVQLTTADLTGTGKLEFHTSTMLYGASGQTGMSANVQVFAWATDVVLAGPTAALAVQSEDEYADGPISRPASSVAAFASKFKDTPIVGRFARATEIGASAVSSIAALFGYSNPPNIDAVHYFQNTNMPHVASSGISTGMQKLTLDPKSELSIDGLLHDDEDTDNLNISYICSKESLICSTTWATTDAVDTQIFTARVQPMIANSSTETGCTRWYTTPSAHLGLLFQYWRGDIIFRFKFVVSKFHKGRVRISYDPTGNIDTNADTINTVYTEIVDIGEENDVEIVIPYIQWSTWKYVRYLSSNWVPGGALSVDPIYDNGIISVRTLTQLSAPASSALANMLVFVRAGDNFEFSVPVDRNAFSTSMITPLQVQSEDNVDIKTRVVTFGKCETHPKVSALNIGEVVRSLRQVLHRSTLAERIPITSLSAGSYAKYQQYFTRLPLLLGYDSYNNITLGSKIAAGTGNSGVNYVNFSPLHHILMMYMGYRGSLNHQFNISNSNYGSIDNFVVSRYGKTIGANYRMGGVSTSLSSLTPSVSNTWNFLNMSAGNTHLGGAAITSQRNNNSLSVVLPDYNIQNFRLYDPRTTLLGESATLTNTDTYMWEMTLTPIVSATQSTQSLIVDRWISAGVDFSTVFFVCTDRKSVV